MPALPTGLHLIACFWVVRLQYWPKQDSSIASPPELSTIWSGDADAEEMLASFLSLCNTLPKPL